MHHHYDPQALSPRQEVFAQAFAGLCNGAEAHRIAYNGRYGENSRRGACEKRSEQARRLLTKPKIAARVADLIDGKLAELSTYPGKIDELVQLTERRDRMQERANSVSSHSQESATCALGADQLADLVRIAARDDLPAGVRSQAIKAVQSHLAELQAALSAQLGI